jgi:hypothetical protein
VIDTTRCIARAETGRCFLGVDHSDLDGADLTYARILGHCTVPHAEAAQLSEVDRGDPCAHRDVEGPAGAATARCVDCGATVDFAAWRASR